MRKVKFEQRRVVQYWNWKYYCNRSLWAELNNCSGIVISLIFQRRRHNGNPGRHQLLPPCSWVNLEKYFQKHNNIYHGESENILKMENKIY